MGERLSRCGFPRPEGSGTSIRMLAHAVDYAAAAAVDYDAAHLWISQHVVLGRIYPHLSVLWISASRGEPSSLGTGYRLPNEPGALV